MAKKQLVEREGVLFEVHYEPGSKTEGPQFESVRVLDGSYRATGPNLILLFHKMFRLVNAAEGELFLSDIAEDLVTL